MTTSSSIESSAPVTPSGHRRPALRARAVVAAAAVAAAGWLVAVPLGGVDLQVEMQGTSQTVGLGAVTGATLTAGLLAWALLALLERHTRGPVRLWTAVALSVAVLSLVAPLTSAATAVAATVLVALHLAVAAVLVPMLRRSSPGERA